MTPLEQQIAINSLYFKNHTTKIESRVKKARAAFIKYVHDDTKVLDVGCGDGTILSPFTKSHKIDGIEAFKPLAEQAEQRGYKTVRGFDLNSNPWNVKSRVYDAVFFGEVSEHLPDVDLTFSEINRVLVSNGVLIYTFTNIRTPIGLFMMIFQNRPPMGAARYRSPHYKDFTTSTATLALENNGFRVINMAGTTFGPDGNDVLPRLASLLPSWSTQVVVVAEKICDAIYDPKQIGKFEIY